MKSAGLGRKNLFEPPQYLIPKFLLSFYNHYFVQENLRQAIIMKINVRVPYLFLVTQTFNEILDVTVNEDIFIIHFQIF